jgi:hypothetical protein
MAVVLAAGFTVLTAYRVEAGSSEGRVAASGITVGGQPLAQVLRISPDAPFILFDSSRVSRGEYVGVTAQAPARRQRGGRGTTKILIGGAIGGAGAF